MPALSETRVWFLRHGESTFNLEHRCQGSCDEPQLTPRGWEAARHSGERLAAEGIDAIISSPLGRAAQSAEQVLKILRAQGQRVTFESDDRLREIDLYNWEGLPLQEIASRFPEQYYDWRFRPDEFRMQLSNEEVRFPVRDLYDRVRLFWDCLLATHTGKSILLVSHGGTIRALVALALGLGPAHFHSFQQSNCGLSRLCFPSDFGPAKLDLLNDTTHLDKNLPKLKEGRHGMRLLFIPVTKANAVAINGVADALDGIVVERVLVAGAIAENVASQLFPSSSCDSSLVVSAANAAAVIDDLFHDVSGDQLRHIAVLGPSVILQRILRQQLSISDTATGSVDMRPCEITSLHLPGNGVPPVLQAINMTKRSPALAGV